MNTTILNEVLKKAKHANRLAGHSVTKLYTRKREGTGLQYNEVFEFAKTIPFIHNTKPENMHDIVKSKSLLSVSELGDRYHGGDYEEATQNTYPLDIGLGTHRNIFFTWGIPCLICTHGYYLLVSYDKMKNQSAYAQMEDVYNTFEKLEPTFVIPKKRQFSQTYDFERESPDTMEPEDFDMLDKDMRKQRHSIREFVKLQAYLMWRLAAKEKISRLSILVDRYFAIMTKKETYNEIHVIKEFNIKNAYKVVWYGGNIRNFDRRDKANLIHSKIKMKLKALNIPIDENPGQYMSFKMNSFIKHW